MPRAFPSGNRGLEVAFYGRQPRPADFNKRAQSEKRSKGKLSFALRLWGRKFLKWLAAKWRGGFDWGIGEQEDCAGAVFGLRIL